jgi:cell division septum initiation protein DivIVA
MISHATASKIPTGEALMIIDAIDSRDKIIDNLLDQINNKYKNLSEENIKLKESLKHLQNNNTNGKNILSYNWSNNVISASVAEKNNPLHIIRNTIPSDKPVNSAQLVDPANPVIKQEVIVTESTQKGYEICKPIASRNYTKYYPHHTNDSSGSGSHIRLFNEITNILSEPEKEIILPGHHVIGKASESQTIIKLNKKAKSDLLNLDGTENLAYDYGIFAKKKKFLSGLIGITTDFVSDTVYVEKILERLDIIVNDMNNDKQLLDIIFKDKLDVGEYGKLGIIFKGGNVYKLFSQILNKQLDTFVFQNYLDDTERYFKKSDCDFGLILIKYSHTDLSYKKVLHLPRSDANEKLISTLQFMILNKYRNDFLDNDDSFDYLSLCGKNDRIMINRMNKMAKSMINLIQTIRLEYEQTIFKYLINLIKFSNIDPAKSEDQTYKKYISKSFVTDTLNIKPNTYDTHTFIGILSNDPEMNFYVNTGNEYDVINGNIVDWYKLFLGYALRKSDFFPTNEKFRNIRLTTKILAELQELSTDKAEWRDIRTLYNVKNITNIIIGDNVYPINYDLNQTIMSDTFIYNSVIRQTQFPDSVSEIALRRYGMLNRLHSNRNDFTIKFSRSNPYKIDTGEKVVDDIMKIKTIPFEPNQLTQEKQSFITPFYISINKTISGSCVRLQNPIAVNNWMIQMERMSKFGSSGFSEKDPNNNKEYVKMYEDIYNNRDNLTGNNYKTLNFGLSRLLVSFNIIVETYDSRHYALPLPSEYIDLSYSYDGDYKVILYERYNGYLLFNGNINPPAIKIMTKKYKKVIDYVINKKYIDELISAEKISESNALIHQKKILDALKQQNYNELIKDKIIISQLYDIVDYFYNNLSSDLQSIFTNPPQTTDNMIKQQYIMDRIDPILKIIKYYTHYGSDISQSNTISNDVLFFPKLSTFILDLYTILFVDTLYPWADAKYAKRLQRYIFFVFIEQLRDYNTLKIFDLLNAMGIKVYENGKTEFLTKIQEFIDTCPTLSNADYQSYNSLSRTYQYMIDRSKYIIDDDNISHINNILISSCGIDKFMYSYHLLDFFDIYKNRTINSSMPFIRCQFLTKSNFDDSYIVVSLTYDEAIDINTAKNIINSASEKLSEFNTTKNESLNPLIQLPSENKSRRYTQISQSSEDDIMRELFKYITVVSHIREKLLITIYNLIYDNCMMNNGKINIINSDPNIMMLNIYEGDIDKILTVV